MTDLSPAAKAIFDAYVLTPGRTRDRLAATLRALAVRIKGADGIRRDVLDIADELEGTQ